MTEETRAEETLQTIRALLDRREIYRAVSARVALIAGVLSIALAAVLYWAAGSPRWIGYTYSKSFVALWLGLLGVMALVSIVVLRCATRADGRPFFSWELRYVLQALAPILVIPAAATVWYFNQGFLGSNELLIVTGWIAFYGLALLSTASWAPRFIGVLGWAFLFSGLFVPTLLLYLEEIPSHLIPNLLMGLTFGGYHLVYALAAWPRKNAR